MKSTSNSRFRALFGLNHGHAPVRLARTPFILAHIVLYALAFFCFQLLGFILAKTGQGGYEMGDFAFGIFLLIVTLLLSPVHIRRAHDLGWSHKVVVWFSIVPAILRIVCFVVPISFFAFAPSSLPTLMKLMPYIGILYWTLNQVQTACVIVLAFAPGTGTHNPYGDGVMHSFTLRNLFGFSLRNFLPAKKDKSKSVSNL